MSIHTHVVREQIANGDLTAAGATIDANCPRHEYNHWCVEALADLATASALSGDIGLAKQVIGRGSEIAERITYVRERISAFLSLWTAMIAVDDSDRARDALSRAIEAANTGVDGYGYTMGYRVEALIGIAEFVAKAGDADGADRAVTAAAAGDVGSSVVCATCRVAEPTSNGTEENR